MIKSILGNKKTLAVRKEIGTLHLKIISLPFEILYWKELILQKYTPLVKLERSNCCDFGRILLSNNQVLFNESYVDEEIIYLKEQTKITCFGLR